MRMDLNAVFTLLKRKPGSSYLPQSKEKQPLEAMSFSLFFACEKQGFTDRRFIFRQRQVIWNIIKKSRTVQFAKYLFYIMPDITSFNLTLTSNDCFQFIFHFFHRLYCPWVLFCHLVLSLPKVPLISAWTFPAAAKALIKSCRLCWRLRTRIGSEKWIVAIFGLVTKWLKLSAQI